MSKRNAVDPAKAVAMSRDKGLTVSRIAAYFGVQKPAVYRAFRSQGYETDTMRVRREQIHEPLLPTAAKHNPRIEALPARNDNLPPPVKRDPCFRCGTRGDIGCGCSKARVGWCAG